MLDHDEFDAAAKKLADGLARLGHVLIVQGAMGWMHRGDLDRARETLSKLPAGRLVEVSVAAAGLAALADELLADTTRVDAD